MESLERIFKKNKDFKMGFGPCNRNRWIKFDKKAGLVTRLVDTITDEGCAMLGRVAEGKLLNDKELKSIKKRKWVVQKKVTEYIVSKGPKFGQQTKKVTQITTEALLENTDEAGNWVGPAIREMNLQATAKLPPLGCLHPLMKVRQEFREILLCMGFEEMPTNQFVESSFWNFDTLFQPQAHPARDSHDTFFLNKPKSSKIPDHFKEYFERVRQTHQNGWKTGSVGWRTPWKESEAEKNLLRTHTTAVSSQMLYKLAEHGFTPKKYFSIDRVFRNETVDGTHLAEFHQIEGFVADRGLTLGHLMGTIKAFFNRIGIPDVKFKPAYNPYTEPSMEIFGYSPERKAWMELGNSGMFRPEMLRPMGLPEDVNVIAWGFGLERPTMIKYKIKNIRDLFGPSVNLKTVRANAIPRFDKFQ